jgi:hypothetical protein
MNGDDFDPTEHAEQIIQDTARTTRELWKQAAAESKKEFGEQ